jgi:predicted Zn-dependent peptidase
VTDVLEFPLNEPDLRFDLPAGSRIRRTVHPSGLRVLTEHVPGARSVTVGFWVAVGSRDEQADRPDAPASLGSTHFLEHLLFKGTKTRNAQQIAAAFDGVGAEHNALTAKEHTCYYAKVRDLDLELAVRVLTDMVTESVLDSREFETERGVILEELAMADDDLSDVASELFFSTVFGDHPLGRPIGGTPEIIQAARRDDVWQHYLNQYGLDSLVISAAGAVDHDQLLAWILSAMEGASDERWNPNSVGTPRPRRSLTPQPVVSNGGLVVEHRPGGQVNLMMGMPGIRSFDDRRYALSMMNAVLGSGMSSRLFQEIRERRGLAYTTYSFGAGYSDSGAFGMYAGCAPDNASLVVELAREALLTMAQDGITAEERDRVLGQIAGSAALALEDSDTRMGRLARSELGNGQLVDLDETIRRHAEVSYQQIQNIARELADQPLTVVAVGDIHEKGFAI